MNLEVKEVESKDIPHETPKKAKNVVPGTAAFSKGIYLMQLIADFSQNPTKSELVAKSGFPRQTLHRILKALIAEQLVEQAGDGTFRLGSRMFQFAGRAIEQNDVIGKAEPELRRLATITEETTHLAVRSGDQMVYLFKQDSPLTVRLATTVGGRVALHASSIGKSLLAFLPDEERREILDGTTLARITDHTVTCKDALREQLEKIKQCGYSAASQESVLDVHCFGAPIFDHRRTPIAGVSISVPIYRLKDDVEARYINPLLETCERISAKVGG